MDNTALPPYVLKALQGGVDLIDVLQGHIKNRMYDIQEAMDDANNDIPIQEDEYYESDVYYEGYNAALTEVYQLCYNLIFYKQDMESNA